MIASLKDRINFYEEFKQFYVKIIKAFKFDIHSDNEARDFLHKIILKKSKEWNLEKVLDSLNSLIISKNTILVYGCGPSLEETIDYILDTKGKHIFNNFLNFTADGASRLLRENEIRVDAVFTDLDGITNTEFYYSKFVVLHAHGDNLNKLQDFEEHIIKFENIICTTQVEPLESIINHGGFTDGDRILFFLKSLVSPEHKIFLIGMDFDKIIGKYSKVGKLENFKGSKIKIMKLTFAKKLIEWIKNQIECPIYYVNSTTKSKNFLNISLNSFEKLVLNKY
ncbi:MAG: 6-hydroxymethylpterin diphosphokinase MptE-like protein [Candidatus Hermodarchaeota archaeon]